MSDELPIHADAEPAPRLPFELCLVLLLTGVAWLALAVTLLIIGWHAEATRGHRRTLSAIVIVMLLGGGWAILTAIHDLRPRRTVARE